MIGLILGVQAGLIAAASCFAGGLWLSPDLDTRSNALNRWGPLGFLWWPYRRLIPHRSLWSHGPLIGTALRLIVLLGWVSLWFCLVANQSPITLLNRLQGWMEANPRQLLALLLGLETSVWIHLILDGDPWPAEWSGRKRR